MVAETEKRIKVIIAKTGIDVHDTGAKTITRMLREAGMEVVYLGLYNTADTIASASMEEDADVVGVSFHEAGYLRHAADLMKALQARDSRALVMVGGIIKEKDIPELSKLGVAGVFLPGSTKEEIATFITDNLPVERK